MRIAIIASHPDDIEFSMGATLAKLTKQSHEIKVFVFSTSEIPGNDGITSEVNESIQGIYNLDLRIYKYPTMHFREHFQSIRDMVFKIKQDFNPEIVYCKSPNALHPDHQVIGESCESIFLESTIYGMEGIRDGHNQKVNKWVIVSVEDLDVKISAIACYKSQQKRTYSDAHLIESWARFRGGQIGSKYAEAFEVIREIS